METRLNAGFCFVFKNLQTLFLMVLLRVIHFRSDATDFFYLIITSRLFIRVLLYNTKQYLSPPKLSGCPPEHYLLVSKQYLFIRKQLNFVEDYQ